MNLMPIESFIKITFGVAFQITPMWILSGIALFFGFKILYWLIKAKFYSDK